MHILSRRAKADRGKARRRLRVSGAEGPLAGSTGALGEPLVPRLGKTCGGVVEVGLRMVPGVAMVFCSSGEEATSIDGDRARVRVRHGKSGG